MKMHGNAEVRLNFLTFLSSLSLQDDDLGFAVLNKPGDVPIHPSLSNHTDDVVSKYSKALNKKKKQLHVSLPTHYPEIDTEAYGLLAVATKSQFSAYMTQLLKAAEEPTADGEQPQGLSKVYKCLVCVKDPDRMGLMEAFQKTGNLITHYYDPVQHRFNRNPPQQQQQQHAAAANQSGPQIQPQQQRQQL